MATPTRCSPTRRRSRPRTTSPGATASTTQDEKSAGGWRLNERLPRPAFSLQPSAAFRSFDMKDNHTQHISQQFNTELEEIRSHLLAMGGLVEKQVNDAVTALIEADSGLAQQVREVDEQINQMERNID